MDKAMVMDGIDKKCGVLPNNVTIQGKAMRYGGVINIFTLFRYENFRWTLFTNNDFVIQK